MSEQLYGPAKGQVNGAPGPVNRDQLDLPGPYLAPETKVESRIAEIWRNAFNLDLVGLEDDFFDLGGDSFTATLISTAITEQFGYKFQPSILMSRSSVSAISSLLESQGFGQNEVKSEETDKSEYPSHLVAVRPDGELPPLFLVHGRMGITFPGSEFLGGLDAQQPVYFIQALGFFDEETPLRRVPEIARVYLNAMRIVQPSGPLNIGGFCSGGMIAAEIACILADEGEPPASLILVDPPPPSVLAKGRNPGYFRILHRRFLRWWKWYRVNWRLRATGDLDGKRPAEFADRGIPEKFGHQLERMAQIDPDFDAPMPGLARKAYEALLEAFFTHLPRQYDGPADLLSSRERLDGVEAKDHFWHSLLPNLRLHIGAETHSELFRREAGSVARKIQECVSMAGGDRIQK